MPTRTYCSFNAFDKARPPKADVVCIQERPPKRTIEHALPGFDVVYPKSRLALAIAFDQDSVQCPKTRVVVFHRGRARVTPARGYVELRDKDTKTAWINTHLINNAFGPVKRGERAFRRAMWRLGWRRITARAAFLRARGYKVYIMGDLNRKAPFWKSAKRVVGSGYDRIFYPKGVRLVRVDRRKIAGSDHRALFATFED